MDRYLLLVHDVDHDDYKGHREAPDHWLGYMWLMLDRCCLDEAMGQENHDLLKNKCC
jgi:hypothetical protein